MIGQNQIINLRSKGKRPSFVIVEFGKMPKKHKYEWDDPERQIEFRFHPVLYVEKNEMPDLRFLINLPVLVFVDEISDEYTVFLDRLTKAKPEYIVAIDYETETIMDWRKGEWRADTNS